MPAGLSATGDSDTRNYYDMIAARQTIDLRPQLERLDRLILRSAGVDPARMSFSFRPLWQMDAASSATVALNKAQTTQIYAGMNLWPAEVTGRLVQSQVLEDGVFPGAEAIFAELGPAKAPTADARGTDQGGARQPATDFSPDQTRDPQGRWSAGGGSSGALPIIRAANHGKEEKEEEHATGGPPEPVEKPDNSSPTIIQGLLPEYRPNERVPFVPPPFMSKPNAPPTVSTLPAVVSKPPSTVAKPAGIPDNWMEKPSDKKGGTRWSDPNNSSNFVRAMPGDPSSPYPYQQVPYIIRQNGSYRDVNGDPILGFDPAKRPGAHIPPDQFKFK